MSIVIQKIMYVALWPELNHTILEMQICDDNACLEEIMHLRVDCPLSKRVSLLITFNHNPRKPTHSILISQKNPAASITEAFVPDLHSPFFQKPDFDTNIASGFPTLFTCMLRCVCGMQERFVGENFVN